MSAKSFVKNIMTRACVYFSVIMLGYIIITAIINVIEDTLLLDAGRVVLFFVFSLLLSVANALFAQPKPSGAVRLLIHFAITLFAFWTCFMLPLSLRTSSTLVGLVTFCVAYFAFMGIRAAFRAKFKENTEAAEEYISQYKKAKK